MCVHTGSAHPVSDLIRGATMGVAHVGAGQCAFVFAPRCDIFRPLHHGGTDGRDVAKQVIDAHFGDAANLSQCFAQFIFRLIAQATREGGNDLLARQSFAGRALDGEDEGEAEFAVVVAIELLQRSELFRRA